MILSKFSRQAVLIFCVLSFPLQLVEAKGKDETWSRSFATSISHPEVSLPSDKRIPLGWDAFPVEANGQGTVLKFEGLNTRSNTAWLRITAAIDFREEKVIEVSLVESKKVIGRFDLRYAHPFQPFQIALEVNYLNQINEEGLVLRQIKGEKDAWFYASDPSNITNTGLQVQILSGSNATPKHALIDNMYTLNSFSPFGWIGGCVHDALWTMSQAGNKRAAKSLEVHLSKYLDDKKGLIYENPRTQPIDGAFNSIEDFLPFSAIANLYPNHVSVQQALDFLLKNEKENGLINSGNHVSTEGCYTVAYPLASMAVQRNSKELAQKAVDQIRLRTNYLTNDSTIFQRGSLEGYQGFANWGRGIAWYMLGTAKTLWVLKNSKFKNMPELARLEDEFRRAASMLSKWQTPEGMWRSFVHRGDIAEDSSASAGIAASFAWGYKMGILDESFRDKALLTQKGLEKYLTIDGFLTQVSQINRGGEALQSSDYRVISQFGMGLTLQLDSALDQ